MGRVFGLVLGGWTAWQYGFQVSDALGVSFVTGMAITFLVAFVVAGIGTSITAGGFQSGIWSTTPVRRLVGLTADGGLFAFGLWVVSHVHILLVGYGLEPSLWITGFPFWGRMIFLFYYVIFQVWLLVQAGKWLKIGLGRGSRPFRYLLRARFVGMGGSSRFGGILEDWANPWRPGMLLLGTSLYDPKWKVGRPDDRHFFTIATSRAGKGRSGIIPNLLTWPGSALVIDPKGQNAAVTAGARGSGRQGVSRVLEKFRLGQTIRIVDPFHVLEAAGVAHPTHRFNPLAELKLTDWDLVERIYSIADALVVPDPHGENFFDNAALGVIAGVIAHVLTAPNLTPEQRTLATVREWLARPGALPHDAMRGNYETGGLAAAAIAQLEAGSEETAGSVMATVIAHTKWLDSLAMRETLAASDFSLAEMKEKPTTVYLVLPPEYIDQHARFLRLFVNLSITAASRGRKPRHAMLFVLDEFYALGRLNLLGKAAGLLAGYGVKLWPIVQNLGQMKELYPENWETFMGNAGMVQAFAMNDQTTANYLSEALGHHVMWRKTRGYGGVEWVPQGATFLRTSVELARETSRDSNNQIVYVEGSDSFLLRRMPYDHAFEPGNYDPDPFESGHRVPWRYRLGEWSEGRWLSDETWDLIERKFGPYVNELDDWIERRRAAKRARLPPPVEDHFTGFQLSPPRDDRTPVAPGNDRKPDQ